MIQRMRAPSDAGISLSPVHRADVGDPANAVVFDWDVARGAHGAEDAGSFLVRNCTRVAGSSESKEVTSIENDGRSIEQRMFIDHHISKILSEYRQLRPEHETMIETILRAVNLTKPSLDIDQSTLEYDDNGEGGAYRLSVLLKESDTISLSELNQMQAQSPQHIDNCHVDVRAKKLVLHIRCSSSRLHQGHHSHGAPVNRVGMW